MRFCASPLAVCIVAKFLSRFSRSSDGGCPTSPTQYAAHSGGSVNPIQLSTIMMLPITLSAPSSLPVITMPATFPLIALRPVALYSSSSASKRSMTRCIRLERPPHQMGVQKRTMSAALIFVTRRGQSSAGDSRKPSPTGSAASERRTISAAIGARARISSRTRAVSSPVLDGVGSCLRDALSASTLKGASEGITHGKRGFVLYMASAVCFTPRPTTPRNDAPAHERIEMSLHPCGVDQIDVVGTRLGVDRQRLVSIAEQTVSEISELQLAHETPVHAGVFEDTAHTSAARRIAWLRYHCRR